MIILAKILEFMFGSVKQPIQAKYTDDKMLARIYSELRSE